MNWLLLKNSLLVAGASTVCAVTLGALASLFSVGLDRRWRKCLLVLSAVTLTLPPFLVTNTWLHYLGASGIWRGWFPLNILSLAGCVWILSLLLWPVTTFLVGADIFKLEKVQLECDMAVRGWPLFRFLVFPRVRRSLGIAAVLTFILALNNFAVPAILQVKVFPVEVWIRFANAFDTLGALLVSWPLVLAPLLLLIWIGREKPALARFEGDVPAKLFRRQIGIPFFVMCSLVTVALCFFSVALPLLQLGLAHRTWAEMPGALAAGKSDLANSVYYAGLSALVVVLIAAAGCVPSISRLSSKRSPAPIEQGFTLALWLPFLIPGVLLGIGLIKLFGRIPLISQSPLIVVLAFSLRYVAFTWHALRFAVKIVDPCFADAARVFGASKRQVLLQVYWPQIAPTAYAATYIVFLLCLWDVESLILVVPAGGETLSLRIFNLLHYGHNAQVNALCATVLFVAITPLLLWQLWGLLSPFARKLGYTLPVLLILTGCEKNLDTKEATLQSRLFQRTQIIGTRGVGVGQLNKPRSLALDLHDNAYVVDMTGRVQKFSPEGNFLLSWQMPQTDLGKPKGMCHDLAGNIVVLEPHYQRVNHFSTDGRLVAQWGQRGTNNGEFNLPRAVACNSRGEMVVTEYGAAERVQKFATQNHEFICAFGHSGLQPGEFNRPEGVCVDDHDLIYVADSCNHRIQIFSAEGKFLRTYGKAGADVGELSYPYDICVDHMGYQFVCEFGNSRIQVFDQNDKPVEIIGRAGTRPGEFNNPWSVALDSQGNLYVADSLNHRVQKLVRSHPASLAKPASAG